MKQFDLSLISVTITTVFASIASLVIFWAKGFLPAKVPLYYSLSWGAHQLASPEALFLLPILAISIMGINVIISKHLHPSQLILKRMLLGTVLVADLLILITVVRILTIYR